ncbi:hypothetical protein [Flavobacterium algicola]|uniref:hypothetical protein n=1 Tax=Flavobacterium algicola TaxID=556529 RepID=UPI001EFDB7C4|nr:hypothetical protein [Flavobacterium algicola]MCG9792674.1 hypothetical protein [Flavobacterium algicola]
MELKKDKIEQLKSQGYELNFENTFNQVLGNYKKIALYAGFMILVFGVLLISLIYGGLLSYFGAEKIIEIAKPENLTPEKLTKEFFIIYNILAILLSCLISPFAAGFIKMAYCADHDEEFNVSTIFAYYKFPMFIKLFTATLLIAVFNWILASGFEAIGIASFGIVVSLLVSLFTALKTPMIIFSNLGVIESIMTSVSLISKQAFTIMGLILVCALFSLVGLLGLGIGIIFTLPIMYSLYYILYKEIIGFDKLE